jgi:hypothetical protein
MRTPSHSPMAFGPFFRANAFCVGIVGHKGFPGSVSHFPATSRAIAPYAPWITGGLFS